MKKGCFLLLFDHCSKLDDKVYFKEGLANYYNNDNNFVARFFKRFNKVMRDIVGTCVRRC